MRIQSMLRFLAGPIVLPWAIAVVLLTGVLFFLRAGGLNESPDAGTAWVPLQSRDLEPGALYLAGQGVGPERQIAARLSLPPGEGPFPAVVLLHGSLGFTALQRSYADVLNEQGYVVLAVDSFSGRGVDDVVGRQRLVSVESMVADAFSALQWLRTLPQVDADAVGLVGWSKGGSAALAAGRSAFRERLADGPGRFAAIAAIYPWCGARERVMQRDDVPVLMVLAGQDDWVGADACADLVAEMVTLGLSARVAIYDEAEHGFDAPGTHRVFLPRGRSWRGCHYAADADGFIPADTGVRRPWSGIDGYLEDCATPGVHLVTHAGDRARARKRLVQFLNFTSGSVAVAGNGA